MNQIMEVVPNYSEGRNLAVSEKMVGCFRNCEDVNLLDYSSDKDHNRTVVTVVGEPEALKQPLLDSVKVALAHIDLNKHNGEHPRMGAMDVCPFIPIRGVTMEDAVKLAKEVGTLIGNLDIPVFLYEKAASSPARENLAQVRKGQFEGMFDKMKDEAWHADFGPKDAPHPTFGAVAVGARMPLVAFNVNLNTNDMAIADYIAKEVRFIGGGLRYVKAMGVELKDRNIVQISMNLTDYTKTSLYQAIEMVKSEARRFGVTVVGTEVIGLLPMSALIQSAEYYMGIENFSMDQVLETRIMD